MKKRLIDLSSALILLLFFVLSINSLHGQTWEREYQTGYNSHDMIELPNQNLVFIDSSTVHCVNPYGDLQWMVNMPSAFSSTSIGWAIELSSDTQIVCISPGNTSFLTTLSFQGAVLSEDTLEYVPSIYTFSLVKFRALPNKEFAYLDSDHTNRSIVVKYNSFGDTLWTRRWNVQTDQIILTDIIACQNGDILAMGYHGPLFGAASAWCARMDSSGNILWQKDYFQDGSSTRNLPNTVLEAPDSSFLMVVRRVDQPSAPDTTVILKMNAVGDSIDQFAFPGYPSLFLQPMRLMRSTDDFPVMYGVHNNVPGDYVFSMRKMDWSANTLWLRTHTMPGKTIGISHGIPLSDSGFAVCGYTSETSPNGYNRIYVSRMDSSGLNFFNRLMGTAYYDLNANCIKDPNEVSVPGKLLSVSGDASLTVPTDQDGAFQINLTTGNYQLQQTSNGSYWQSPACSSPANVSFPGLGDTVWVDIPLEASLVCPELEIDISSFPWRVCRGNIFFVNYENQGTDSAVNASVVVTLPGPISLISSSTPYLTPQSGQVYEFPLGTIGVGESGTIEILAYVGCNTQFPQIMGSSGCATAYIYPDSICTPPPASWDGASVAVEMECINNDSLRFAIRNVGSSAMLTPGNFIVLEDNILRISNSFQLPAGDSLVFYETANGSTWMLQADQRPGHPGNSHPLVALEGCGLDSTGNFSKGFLTMYPQDDQDKFVSIYCSTFLQSFDPNDKLALPVGMGPQHLIDNTTELEYMIRFQNTGNSLAFDVKLLDTLDPNLDPASIRYLGSSHPHQTAILSGGILEVSYPNILLPDSTFDEPNSHGFFKFAISPKPNLSPGTLLENRAGIYFDFNPVVLTNTVFHTISELMYGVVTISPALESNGISLEVFPNPFSKSTTFRLSEPLKGEVHFTVRDLQGKTVHQQVLRNPGEFSFQAGALPSGLYLYEVAEVNGRRSTGKMMIRR